ncbi:hypothetical protein K663_01440 [Sphingobium sp. MI1205]|nr:hypothetical protein K663_01440 [Sphingobium sp. MI1205]
MSMVHQKGHEKRAGEAGGKARFEGWQGGGPGGRPLAAGARRLGGLTSSIRGPDRRGMMRKNVARASPVHDGRLQNAIDRLGLRSPYVPYQETRHATH